MTHLQKSIGKTIKIIIRIICFTFFLMIIKNNKIIIIVIIIITKLNINNFYNFVVNIFFCQYFYNN